ncbi:MAG TPA: hypothetical protein VNZ03_06655 [Terriglobales bacterium]|jgi:hypothetical protein|nr:hypothetical protein [Terriglobales bacterium]
MNKPQRIAVCGVLVLSSYVVGFAQSPSVPSVTESPSENPLYLKVRLSDAVKVSKLHSADNVEGVLAQSVYSGDHELFPAGSHVHLIVSRLERRRRARNDHWPWVVQLFTPRHENSPAFQVGNILLPSGAEVPLKVSVLSVANSMEIEAGAKSSHTNATSGSTIALEAFEPTESLPQRDLTHALVDGQTTVAAGTQGKIVLLRDLSASKSRPGDTFQARLVEPVRVGSVVALPEGTLFQGKVEKNTPPRWLSRPGSLLVTFTGITLPGSSDVHPVQAAVAGAEIDRRSHTRIDPEGHMRGERPGAFWMVVNAGVAGGLAKEVDDATQLIVEAIVSTATDVSTGGGARIVGICASSLFMITRHGRDVVLPRFTEMKITFVRPASLAAIEPVSNAPRNDPVR